MSDGKLRALIEATRRVLTWVEPITGDNRDLKAAAEETASVEELTKLLTAAESHLSASSNEGWRTMDSAPRDGTKFLVWADGYEWPETIMWQDYDPDTAADVGHPGYFRYADDALADIAEVEEDLLTRWHPLPPPPSPGEEQTPQSMEQGR